MSNWAFNLDMLAQNGVIDFDAPSFVMGQNPRYVGNPSYPPSPYVQVPPAPNLNQPQVDEFHQQKQEIPPRQEPNKNPVKNPFWKKLLFGAVAVGALIFGGKKIVNLFRKKPKTTVKTGGFFKKIGNFFVETGKKIGNFFKECWNKLVKVFKK